MTFISYAQNCEDVLLWRALGTVGHGFYIDVGALHPDTDSVTRAFYDRGWSGVNIEPVAEQAARIRAARPRDITLQVALGAEAGEAPFFVVDGTGLSTLDRAVVDQCAGTAHKVRETTIPVRTLAEICRLHARPDIHFLKIDVEGAEQAVIEGADLLAFRPWIILAEATAPLSTRETHNAWEPLLLAADYVFVWFDGLNRYYISCERHDMLAPAFRTPPNVFDDFLRANDHSLVARVGAAELERDSLRSQLRGVEAGLQDQAFRARNLTERAGHEITMLRDAAARQRAQTAREEAARLGVAAELHESRHELQHTHLRLQSTEHALHHCRHELQQTHLRLQATEQALHALHRSHSWRLTAPLRQTIRLVRRVAAAQPTEAAPPAPQHREKSAADVEPAAEPPPSAETPDLLEAPVPGEALPILPPPGSTRPASGGPVAVHQFHSGSAVGDAITNAMLLTRGLLRSMGYLSEIYTEHPPVALAHELRPMEELPRHDGYVLIVRHSMGYDRFPEILDLSAPKVLIYHNITPPDLLARHPYLANYARLGRAQLAAFGGRVVACLADSEYNAIELRRLELAPVRVCTLLFDIEALRARAAAAVPAATVLREAGLFTILFVGRINEAKGQLALVEAYAAFRKQVIAHGRELPSRLVLIGREDGAGDLYARVLRERIAALGLQPHVLLTGGVPDHTLDAWYGASDLYVSLSRHEGFGVPLIEAMAHGVPVLAWPGGAVPYTLAGAGVLLEDTAPEPVAAAMLSLTRDISAYATVRAKQAARLDRFALDRQALVLQQALFRAGAALPPGEAPDEATEATLLAANLRISIAGHVNGTYSLAAINRDLALELESVRPGRVRLLPVEGGPTLDLSGVPAEQSGAVAALVHRSPHPTGPELVISQHYPVHVPERAGDVPVAILFWEESLLPAPTIALLGRHFRAVVAPTGFVRDALIESGLRIPVRVIPPAVRLEPFAAQRAVREAVLADPVHRVLPEGAAHRFLHVSSCFPRKGVDVLLRAWQRAFRAGDPVRLTIKGFPNPHNEVAAMLASLREADPGLAPVELIDRDLDLAGLLALYADADTMVLPTRGEGFNLPAAEALSAGLRLIVTGRGGHTEFCGDANGPHPGVRLLRYRPAPSQSHVATPNSLWLEPDEDDLVDGLREALQPGMDAVAPPVLPDAEALARAYTSLATDLLLAPPRLPVRISWVSSWSQRCGIAEYSRQLLAGIGVSELDVDEPGNGVVADAGAEDGGRPHIRVLCDTRTPAVSSTAERFWPCWQIGDVRTLLPLAAAVAADDADAVMLQHQPGLLSFETLTALVDHPALAGRVVLATLHNTRYLDDLPADERMNIVAALARLDRILVHTMADLHRLQGYGITDNLMVLPHGVARPLAPAPIRAFDDPITDTPLIGCHGFFLPGKGIDALIEAVSRLRLRWPRIRLLLVNAEYDSPHSREEIERCVALAETLGIADSVTFHTGFLQHTRSLEMLSHCDVVALPYRPSLEAARGAARAAMNSGVPVAVTPIGLFDELDDAVFRFAGTDVFEVASGIDGLLRDQDLRMTLQRSAQNWMSARQWPGTASRLFGMIEGLVRARQIMPAR